MASNVFPMLSSSPPPMDDCPDDDDDDDEFGNFASANIPFDSSFDSPVSVDKLKQFKSGDNGVNDTNLSQEINKFHSFSNCATPSPQEFVSNFSDENKLGKNSFVSVKHKSSRISESDADADDSTFCKQDDTSSHKSASCELNSSIKSELVSPEYFNNSESTFLKCPVQNSINKTAAQNFASTELELTVFQAEPDSTCYVTKESEDLSSGSDGESRTCITCDEPKGITFPSDSVPDIKFIKDFPNVRKHSFDKSSTSADKFTCDFNFEDKETNSDKFDYQQSERNFSYNNEFVNLKSSDCESPIGYDDIQNSPETVHKIILHNNHVSESFCDFAENEFDDFQGCKESESFAQNDEISLHTKSIEDHEKCIAEFNSQHSERNTSPCNDLQNLKSPNCDYPDDLDDVHCNFKKVPEASYNEKCKKFDDFSDNEFDDFQSCADKVTFIPDDENSLQDKSADNFEYDDFQDFQYSNDTVDETKEFTDFQDFSEVDATSAADFADFSAVPFDSNKTPQSSETGQFADFEEASFSVSSNSSFQASSSQKSVDTLSTVINAIFPLSDSPSEETSSDELSPQILEQSNKSRRLWEKLHEVEQTPGLRFQWGVSHSFQQLLRSVNVDYHSILRTSSVPIFASGLSLLEPVKGLSNSVNHELEDRNSKFREVPKDSIPPVEFDWNSSGLVNPLDSGQCASTLMDLSFLSSVETDSTSKDHSFENELLKPSPALPCPDSSSKTQILEQLLSKNVSSLPNSKLTRRPSGLSQEAVRVLDQLPDLSFMQAKVLMFPISSKT